MRKLFVSVMCLLMLLSGFANESDVKMNDGALPAAQMDAVQNDVPQPTVAVDVRKADTIEPAQKSRPKRSLPRKRPRQLPKPQFPNLRKKARQRMCL